MLWWFVETTLIAGVLSGLAALLGRAAHHGSHGQAPPVARGSDQVRDTSGRPFALGDCPPRDQLASQPI